MYTVPQAPKMHRNSQTRRKQEERRLWGWRWYGEAWLVKILKSQITTECTTQNDCRANLFRKYRQPRSNRVWTWLGCRPWITWWIDILEKPNTRLYYQKNGFCARFRQSRLKWGWRSRVLWCIVLYYLVYFNTNGTASAPYSGSLKWNGVGGVMYFTA